MRLVPVLGLLVVSASSAHAATIAFTRADDIWTITDGGTGAREVAEHVLGVRLSNPVFRPTGRAWHS
jgi:hypothetical protein